MNKILLTLGHGYVARALAQELQAEGWQILSTCRSHDDLARLQAQGITAVLCDGSAGATKALQAMAAEASHILHSAPPLAGGTDPFLAALGPAQRAWVGYLSTTGVYGDRAGGWVDEDSPIAPARGRSLDRALAEQAWLGSGWAVEIFRLSGIYGPGRGPFEKLRRGTAQRIIKPGQVFGRIHRADILAVLRAAIAGPHPKRIYNLADDLPCGADVVLAHAAGLLGQAPPPAIPFERAALSPMARSFYAESRRVRNARIKAELGVELLYPTYREGLAAILRAETGAEPA